LGCSSGIELLTQRYKSQIAGVLLLPRPDRHAKDCSGVALCPGRRPEMPTRQTRVFAPRPQMQAVGSVRGARTPACRAHTHVGACASNAMRNPGQAIGIAGLPWTRVVANQHASVLPRPSLGAEHPLNATTCVASSKLSMCSGVTEPLQPPRPEAELAPRLGV